MHNNPPELIEGKDYYINEQGLWVFTAEYLARGYCCGNRCLYCPYTSRRIEDDSMSPAQANQMILTTDQKGNELSIPFPPKRIISLVPSQTELLFDLRLENEIIGVTKFCVLIHICGPSMRQSIFGVELFRAEDFFRLGSELKTWKKEKRGKWKGSVYSLQACYAGAS